MRRAGLLIAIVAAACVGGPMAVAVWNAVRPDIRPGGDPSPREVAVVIDPELTDEHAWRVGRNPPGPLVNRWIDLEAETLDDGRLHVVRRLPRPDYEDVHEFWIDLAITGNPKVTTRGWTRELASGKAWHVHDLEGTVCISSARLPTEPASAPLIAGYELRGQQSGSEQNLRGKFALDPALVR